MRAYSLDLRERVLAAVDAGMLRAEVLTTFRISRGTLQRWLKRRADGLPLAGRTGPGRPSAIRGLALDQLHDQLVAHPDATLEEHLALWNGTHPPVSRATIARALLRLKLTVKKKSLYASEQDPSARAAFAQRLSTRPAADFVVIDECGSNLNLTRRYARAPRGQRAYGYEPRNTPPNTTLIASLTLEGIGPSLIVPGATDRLAFEAYIEHVLVPALRPGQIVVLNNLSVLHGTRVAELITAQQCELWFLPSYSPDYSPIEPAFAKLKAAWRKAAARTPAALEDAIATSLPTITAADARAFFTDCGYAIHA